MRSMVEGAGNSDEPTYQHTHRHSGESRNPSMSAPRTDVEIGGDVRDGPRLEFTPDPIGGRHDGGARGNVRE